MPNLTLDEGQWSECESVIRRFERAWRDSRRPDPASFVTPDSPHATRLLAELVHVDLEFRVRAGEAVRVEEYLDRFPVLATAEHRRDLLRAEFALRRRQGEAVTPDEYGRRFPEDSDELRDLLGDGRSGPLTPTRPAVPPGLPLTVAPTIPGYELLGELGRGGMGVVYKARDVILHRTVAVKTLATVPADGGARFAREAEAIARLDHPNIVPVYEVGEWRAGDVVPPVPYFVMKWYPGGSLDAAPAGPGADPAAHARTVERVARAVHHAHQRGILHRDLKPSNILLDEAGGPYVADFGLAGRFDPVDPRTLTAAVMGTPAYMAPEQARTPKQVTTAVDVYGLGAILYHQLTGRPPFQADTPLATLDRAAADPPTRPSAVNPSVPRDLETICLKCLEKDPARRYASAAELADDLRRWLDGEPITARPTRVWEHAWRWVRRHPLVAAMAAATAAALVVAVVTHLQGNARIREQAHETNEAYLQACALGHELHRAIERQEESLYVERVASAGRLYASNQLPQAWALLDPCPEALRRWEWRYLDGLRRGTPPPLLGHTGWVRAAAFLADDRLATGDELGVVRVWDAAAGAPLRTWDTGQGRITELAAHPTRNWLAVAGRDSVAVWDADTGGRLCRLPGGWRVKFSPCGRWAVTADLTVAWVWALPGWEPRWELTDHRASVSALAFTPDGGRLLTGTRDGTVRAWDLATGKAGPATWKRPRPITGLAFTAGGEALVESHPEGVVVADPATGQHRHRIDPTGLGRAFMAVGPAGWVGVTGADGQVIVWDVAGRQAVRVFHGRMASGGGDLAVRVWDLSRHPGLDTLAGPGPWAGTLAVSPDGARVAVGPRPYGTPSGDRVLVLDAATGRELRRLPTAGDVAFSPDSRRLATGWPGGGVTLWDAETGAAVWSRPDGAGPGGRRLAFSPDGSQLAVADPRGGVRLLATADGSPAGSLGSGGGVVHAVGFSPDGSRLAVAGADGLDLWDVRARERVRRVDPGRRAVAGHGRRRPGRARPGGGDGRRGPAAGRGQRQGERGGVQPGRDPAGDRWVGPLGAGVGRRVGPGARRAPRGPRAGDGRGLEPGPGPRARRRRPRVGPRRPVTAGAIGGSGTLWLRVAGQLTTAEGGGGCESDSALSLRRAARG